MSVIFMFILLLFFVNSFKCSQILIISPHFDRAHYLFSNKLAEKLNKNGHEITFLSPHVNCSDNPDKGFYTHKIYGSLNVEDVDSVVREYNETMDYEQDVTTDVIRGEQISKLVLYDKVVQDLMKNSNFDLVILDFEYNDAIIGLGIHFHVPVICISVNGHSRLTNDLTGNPTPTSYIPHNYGFFSDKMQPWERLANLYFYIYEWYYQNVYHHLKQGLIYYDVFKPHDRTYPEAFQSVPLVLVNSNFLITRPRPNLPNMINVGGYHINKPRPLPKRVDEFINGTARRIILFSFGDGFKTINMTENYRKKWYGLLSQLQQNIVFRSEAPNHTYPANILFDPTISHVDILCNNNVKLFISSGELSSMYEALYCGKPVIGLIINEMKDRQHILKITEDGWGAEIDYHNFVQTGHRIIESVINNPVYINIARRNRKTYFRLLNAEYLTLYWINYVLKHGLKDFSFMISPGRDMPLYIYYSIDVIIFYLMIFIVLWIFSCSFLFFGIKRICRYRRSAPQMSPRISYQAPERRVRFDVEEGNQPASNIRRRTSGHRRGRTI